MSILTTSVIPTIKKAAEHLTELHHYLLELADKNTPYPNPIGEAEPLLSFNGYYALNDTGAFLTIDTNLLVNKGVVTPHVALIYSKDGTSSKVYHLTGPHRDFESVTWSGMTLTAQGGKNSGVPNFTLQFSREDNDQKITSSFQGTITEGDSTAKTSINGKTYNNPIPMEMYAGTYYDDKGKGAEILKIGTDNSLQYNYTNPIGGPGHLQDVDLFIYNLNMYVFSFSSLDGLLNYSIIMGTSAEGGKVCNDLFSLKGTKISIPRSIQTVTSTPIKAPVKGTNTQSEDLANFAGFYPLASSSQVFTENAFISIEGEYKTSVKDGKTEKDFKVTIGVSLNGTSTTVYTFDSTMSFINNGNNWTLTIPINDPVGSELTIHFTRRYQSAYENVGNFYGSVVSISGSYNVAQFSGISLLNVVPLMGFSGAPLKVTENSTETIVIKSDSEIEYKGVSYTNLTVVPLMYIVGFIDQDENEVILSLGTDGGKGNTCITTVTATKEDNRKRKPYGLPTSIELYTAIPNGDSAAPKH
ncbi:hypothetical protein [Acidiluteibacter ferrifornacis]|uniref:Uncharacterized protein n=1 Tax=Acidiluteibacter ferrifornacis TaxID=2692424 RepID=A0A6N9NKZ9_9FLAO|nr:hypothetical protein [Acidiluteibacter ferrifornacis]NBG67376.1 hypothetical protein [Acidiluteibacter ferrifornacis]